MVKVKDDIKEISLQKNGYYKTYGYFIISYKNILNVFNCVSGGYNRGTLPIGLYSVKKPLKLDDTENNKAYKKESFPWVAKLFPKGICIDDKGKRTGLFIHPDGNVEGTLGCLGILQNDIQCYDLLNKIFDNNEEIILEVC